MQLSPPKQKQHQKYLQNTTTTTITTTKQKIRYSTFTQIKCITLTTALSPTTKISRRIVCGDGGIW